MRPVSTFICAVACLVATQNLGQAAPGDQVVKLSLAVPGFGVSVAADCNGTIYYTGGSLTSLHKMDKTGADLGSVSITDGAGDALQMDEMAWDEGRGVLWAQQHGSNPIRIYRLDPISGVAALAFVSATTSIGTFRDGITYEAADDSLWVSGDLSTTIEHYRACDGALIGQITPKNSAGANLGNISGVQVGVGDLLYLGQAFLTKIVQVKKSDGSFISEFASPGGVRDEGLECDAFSFAPTLVIWSRDTEDFLVAIEVEPGTCTCQTPCPDDIDVCNDQGECGAVVNYPDEVAGSICDPPSGSFFPVGVTPVICEIRNPLCPDIPPVICEFTVTVRDCEPPQVDCPANITQCNDPGLCSARVPWGVSASDNCGFASFDCIRNDGLPISDPYPVGTTTVTCTAVDTAGYVSSCSFTIIVSDCEAPTAECVPAVNPAGKKIPTAGQTPNPQGKNEDGFYQLLARDNCDGSNLQIFVKDAAEGPCGGAFAAGPYAPGTVVKLTQSPDDGPLVKPMAGAVVDHIKTRGEPLIVVTDSAGNTTCHPCLVPPPPK